MNLKIKLIVAFAILSLLLGFYKWHTDMIWQAGYDSATSEMSEEYRNYINAYKEERLKLEKDFLAELENIKDERDSANAKWKDAEKKLKVKPVEVINYVEVIKKDSNCQYVGVEFVRMWNEFALSIRAARDSTGNN